MYPEIDKYSNVFLLRLYLQALRDSNSMRSKSSFPGRGCACGSTHSIMSMIGQDHSTVDADGKQAPVIQSDTLIYHPI